MENGCSARSELYFQDVIFCKTPPWKYLWQTEVSPLKYFERKCAHIRVLLVYAAQYGLDFSLLYFRLWYASTRTKIKIKKI